MIVDQVVLDLKREEGWRGLAYDDATGNPVTKGTTLAGYVTVGYGFCLDAKRGRPIPAPVGEFWLRYIVNEMESLLKARWPAYERQDDEVKRALIQMAYQLGLDGLFDFKLMMNALERGDRETAATNALASKWAKQTPARADRVARMLRGF